MASRWDWRGLIQKLIGFILIVSAATVIWLWPRYDYLGVPAIPFSVKRLPDNPIIHADLSDKLQALAGRQGYVNINGPSLIRVPDWIDNPLGKYYLYFAHHKGDAIRLAYADRPSGPWRIHEPGSLSLGDSGFPTKLSPPAEPTKPLAYLWNNFSIYIVRDYLILNYRASVKDPAIRKKRGIASAQSKKPHIASPDVIVDDAKKRLLMYYHGMSRSGMQISRIAVSADGLNFTALAETVPATYLRAFEYRDKHYLLGMPGVLFRSDKPDGGFEPRDRLLFEPDMRHAGLWLDGSTLYVFWSRVGDAPERILLSTVDLEPGDWDDWQATEAVEVLRPELAWEGAELPVLSSLRGEIGLAANELRDPFFFQDEDGTRYLLYAGSGEQAIGLAKLDFNEPLQSGRR